MFYDPRDDVRPAPLTHNPLNALVAPRPIGWIGTVSSDGFENLAPFSYFNAFSADPPIVGFAPNAKSAGNDDKDTLANVREVSEFTASIVSAPLAEKMNRSSKTLDRHSSEFEYAELSAAPSRSVRPPTWPRRKPYWNARYTTSSRCLRAPAAAAATSLSARSSAFTSMTR